MIPASTVPDATDTATTTGCSFTARLMITGCSTWPSIWPITTISTSTASAVSGPRPASATSVAIHSAIGAPISGMNAPSSTSRRQRQRQGHLEQEQRDPHQGRVRHRDDHDAPGVAGEGRPPGPAGGVPARAPHRELAQHPAPQPLTGVQEEQRAEHREREAGEQLRDDARLPGRLRRELAAVLRQPRERLVGQPLQLARRQPQRRPRQQPLDLADAGGELPDQPAELPDRRTSRRR